MSLNPRDDRWGTCVWCAEQTFVWMQTPGRPDIGVVPLHAFCAAEIVSIYDGMRAGMLTTGLPGRTQRRLARFLALPSGT